MAYFEAVSKVRNAHHCEEEQRNNLLLFKKIIFDEIAYAKLLCYSLALMRTAIA